MVRRKKKLVKVERPYQEHLVGIYSQTQAAVCNRYRCGFKVWAIQKEFGLSRESIAAVLVNSGQFTKTFSSFDGCLKRLGATR